MFRPNKLSLKRFKILCVSVEKNFFPHNEYAASVTANYPAKIYEKA
jgi:hypothetical protein